MAPSLDQPTSAAAEGSDPQSAGRPIPAPGTDIDKDQVKNPPGAVEAQQQQSQPPQEGQQQQQEITNTTSSNAPEPPSSTDVAQGEQPTAAKDGSTSTTTLVTQTGATAAAAATTTTAAKPSSDVRRSSTATSTTNPLDFQGSVDTNDEPPSPETLRKIQDYVVLDRDGKSHPFKSLYRGKHVARRVLVIFVRHFFCGNCQEYLRTLSASITPDALLKLPTSTFVAVVGCGDPGLIDMYAAETGCQFPIYADPTQRLYSELGMIRTLALGARPAYTRKSLLRISLESIVQGLKHVRNGMATKGGDQRQIGGEFLFEPAELLSSPATESSLGAAGGGSKGNKSKKGKGKEKETLENEGAEEEQGIEGPAEEKTVTWCHRMKTTRDHTEIQGLRRILGLEDEGSGTPAGNGTA